MEDDEGSCDAWIGTDDNDGSLEGSLLGTDHGSLDGSMDGTLLGSREGLLDGFTLGANDNDGLSLGVKDSLADGSCESSFDGASTLGVIEG
jgi:hypothetical protein